MDINVDEFAILLAQSGPLDGQRWTLNREFIIGRDPSCDIIVPNRQVSRHHARIYPRNKKTYIQDLNSKNGTHYNGNPISEETCLQDGDIIQIAFIQRFLYISSDATLPLANMIFSSQEIESQVTPKEIERRKLYMDLRSRRVWITIKTDKGEFVDHEIIPPLSVSQFRLLNVLYQKQGQVVSRQEIIESVWEGKQTFEISVQALDALIRRLRHRISEVDPSQEYIATVRGHGLRLDNPKLSKEK